MLFSYNWLQSFFKQKLPKPKKLADLLMMHSFEVEEVKKKGNDFIIDLDILPNRIPDCASHIGIAREISAVLNYKLKEKKYELKENKNKNAKNYLEVKVEDKKLCSRYCARVIKEVKVGPSPKWLKEKLLTCGLQPINNIVDATNYIMLETGQPLHAFDFEKLSNKISGNSRATIIVRKAKKGEKITTLEGKKYILSREDLVIANSKTILAIAGVKGGKKAEIDKGTKTIVLESANFERVSVYKTSKKLKLQTDASIRFSAGLDPNLAKEAVDKVAVLIQEIAGGNILSGIIDFYPKKVLPKIIKLDLNYVKSLLGIEIPLKRIIDILKSLGFSVRQQSIVNCQWLIATIPTFRRDFSIEEDLIEEVGRIYGYENFPSKLSILQTSLPQKNKELALIEKLRNLMKGLGFTETYNYSFISGKDAEFFSTKGKENLHLIELLNPVSSNIKYLRFSLIPNILKAVKLNQKRFSDIKFFEIGKIFKKGKEKRFFGAVFVGKEKFFEIKGILNCILRELGIFGDIYIPCLKTMRIWEKSSFAEIKVKKETLGFLGEISKKTLDFYNIKRPVFAFEIDFRVLLGLFKEKRDFRPIPLYPETIRDLSVIVPQSALAGDLIEKIYSKGKNLVMDIEVFDVYEGSPLQKGEKNISFHIIYRAKDRTLTAKEVDKIQENIIKELEKNPQWKVRRKKKEF